MENQRLTGYPSVDKPWLRFYDKDVVSKQLPNCTMFEYIVERNRDYPGDIALIYYNKKITYHQMFRYIEKVADSFSRLGVKAGDVVTIALPNIPENIYCIYALNALGAVANLIDLRSVGQDLLHYYIEAQSSVAVVCSLFVDNIADILTQTSLKTIIVVSPFDSLPIPIRTYMKWKNDKQVLPSISMKWADFLKIGDALSQKVSGKAEDVACIFHTSGTTGAPKGVMLTNQNFNVMAMHIKDSGLKFNFGEKILNQVPPFLAYNTLCATHMPLSLHMQIVMLPEYRPDKFAENIMKLKPNCAIAGPADWNNFLENDFLKRNHFDFSFLVSLISGSDAMTQQSKDAVNELLQKNGCTEKVLEGYGMTEIGSAACVNLPRHDVEHSVGVPLPQNVFCIFDNDLQKELTYCEKGEICMRGPTVMKGYFKNSEATMEILKEHPDGYVWLHSGDLGYISEDGCVFIDGRLKRIIIRHDGIKISPFKIEKALLKNSHVSKCCVVGHHDMMHKRGQVPVAFVELQVGNSSNKEEIVQQLWDLCHAEISEDYLPSQIVIVEKLPITPNGKIDYRTLENRLIE